MKIFPKKFIALVLTLLFTINASFSVLVYAETNVSTSDSTGLTKEIATDYFNQAVKLILSRYKFDITTNDIYKQTLLNLIEKDPEMLSEVFAAMFGSLDDYSVYYTQEELEGFVSNVSGEFCGIGVAIMAVEEGLYITTVYNDSPAKEIGLQIGDIITMVDDFPLAGVDISIAQSKILGKENTPVNLTVVRNGKTFHVNPLRRKVTIQSGFYDTIENDTIDLVVTSPPYYNARDYSHWNTYNDYLSFISDVLKEVFRVTKPGRMVCINISVVIEPRLSRKDESVRYPIPFHLVSIMEGIGYKFIEDIIWVKPDGAAKNRNGAFSQHRTPVAYKPNIVNEYILVFQKPIVGLIDDVIASYSDDIKNQSKVKGGYERTNVWEINPETNNPHPAPYPIELVQKLIEYYSFINDTVLDPFMGSGTTALVAKRLSRKYLWFELNTDYFNLSIDRLKGLDLILYDKTMETDKEILW